MNCKKYVIRYDWKECRDGTYGYHEIFETDSFISFVFNFIKLKTKYKIMQIEYKDLYDEF